MLINALYTVTALNADAMHENIIAVIALNPEHPVFEGHFPGNPILPGVCTIQIVKEILEESFNEKFMLQKAANIKYLGFVSPVSTPDMQFNLSVRRNETGGKTCMASVSAGGNVICTFKGDYILTC
jgi:3-hydroxyacyl-[acyl-carrier-protein] dehydratase